MYYTKTFINIKLIISSCNIVYKSRTKPIYLIIFFPLNIYYKN